LRYPDLGIAVYNRMSSYPQAGKGKVKLEATTYALDREIRRLAPGKVRRAPFFGVEEGKLSKHRPILLEAVEYAARAATRRGGPVILVAGDLSRFIRSEAYHRWKNPEAWPTPEEFDALLAISPALSAAKLIRSEAGGVLLATVADPLLTGAERHKLAMERAKRAGKCGRPREPFPPETAVQILDALGVPCRRNGRFEWEHSITVVAGDFDVPRAKVQRFLDEPVPGRKGLRWKDCAFPAVEYRNALKRRLV
jgi:hypothetical protein